MSRHKPKQHTKESNPLISVIVPVYNRKEWIPLTLESLRSQTYKNVEVAICNDGGEPIDDILSQFQDLNIIYTAHAENKGLPAARNTALKSCHGEFISFLDSDDQYMPLALEFRMWNIKKLNAEIVYTRSLRNIYDPIIQDNQKRYRLKHQELYWNSEFSRDQILWMNICPCCNTLFSRKSWEKTEYWLDETLTSTEDHDFWIALSRKFDFYNLSLLDAECSYRLEPGGQMTGNRDFSQNWIKVFKKWRNTAENLTLVTNTQNAILKQAGIDPEKYGL